LDSAVNKIAPENSSFEKPTLFTVRTYLVKHKSLQIFAESAAASTLDSR